MIGKGATPSFFAIANDNYTLTKKEAFLLPFGTGDEGIEPPLKVLETLVIPFDQSPKSTYQL